MAELQVNDAVHVERGDAQQLEGVVAFLGKVEFADGDDWVGVRLTGASVGLGKNDGSVKGVSYFSCEPNAGVFVRKSHVSKRELSRLEELRLKRELAKQSASAGILAIPNKTATTVSATYNSSPKKTTSTGSSRTLPSASRTAPETTDASSAASSSSKSRLEEIRAKRAALAEKHTAPSSVPPAAHSESLATSENKTPSVSTEDVEQLKQKVQETEKLRKQVQELADKLRIKEEENASLQQTLSKVEQDLHEAKKAEEEEEQEPQPATDYDFEQELLKAQDDCRDMEERMQNALGELDARNRELDRERKERSLDVELLTLARSELSALQHEFQARSDQTANRSASDASHYKERARLQAELGAARRQVEELEKEKVEMESVMEDLALDKEQLQEEKEAMQDRLEELKIDAETAQMEVEELRMEVEIVKEAAEGAVAVGGGSTGGDGTGADADDVAQALSVQNARLREALIRLREQASVEKMELSRGLRAAEKDAAAGVALTEEVETLRAAKKNHEEEIRDLNEMVDQGSAFESMVESLSDRIMVLEDDNLALQATIREMEEAADITAEMEEVQADENKTLMRDLEGRDSIIRNLEEAIKMQRRREEDFQRTVGNYRKTVETLKEEKKALMAFQEGDQGEKGDLLVTSQKALARAAQLVEDAAIARKREAEAVFNRIEADVQRHLSERLERLLPESVSSTEVASVKGELLLSRVAGKASRSLEGMASVFTGIMRSGMKKVSSESDEEVPVDEGAAFELSDEATQCITNMIHQSEVAMSTIDVASDLLKLLAAGQWPDLLSPNASAELGAIVGNSIAELDIVLGDQLRILKEEGVLSPHTSNIGAFHQTVVPTMQSLRTSLEADGTALFPHDWAPPGWRMLHDVSVSKFSCISAGAVVASIVSPNDETYSSPTSSPTSEKAIASIKPLLTKLDQISTEAAKLCHRLFRLDLQRELAVSELTDLAATWKAGSLALLESMKATFSAKSEFTQEEVRKCESVAESTMRTLVKIVSALRAAGLDSETDGKYHPLSPESKDAWAGISTLARAMRSVDGDADDVNYLLRARALESQLMEAVENGPKLSLANTKVSTLEKSLASRSKEILMQNARLSELEKVLAKASSLPSSKAIKSPEFSTSEELNTLKEENRVLTEAMDVLHQQVEEYENEIRFRKDIKSPKSAQRNPRKSHASPFSPGLSTGAGKVGGEDVQDASPAAVGALEAALLRPALQAARRDASMCKAHSFAAVLSTLPPLPGAFTVSRIPENEESKEPESADTLQSLSMSLSRARSLARLEKASVSIVDLRKPNKSSRFALMDSMAKSYNAEMNLADAVLAAERWLSDKDGSPVNLGDSTSRHLVGRVKIAGENPSVVPITVNTPTLQRLHMHILQ